MRLKYGSFVAHFLFLFAFLCSAIGMTIVDDVSDLLVYSTSGPAWWAANYHNGQGRYVNGLSYNQPGVLAHGFTWHETVGDGASVSLTFTGTRVNLTGTVCRIGWPTVVDFYIDGQYMSRFEHQPDVITNLSTSDTYLLYPMANFGNLEPARHTFRAVSVGAGTLFAVDFLAYEPSEAVPLSSNISASVTNNVVSTGSTTSASSTTSSTSRSITSSLSSTSSSFTASRSTESHPAGDSQPVVATMDVPASDSRIVYSPPDTWDTYSNARRATSCLEGTVSSSTAGSYLTYNFTGTNIQVYTVSSPIGGNYSISIDGQDGGIYSSYDPSTDPSLCSSRPLYSTMGLSDAQHTLVLTVLDAAPGSTQDTVQFVGFRVSSASVNQSSHGSSDPGPNIGATVGGVVGGLAGLALLVLLVVWWMRRQRQAEEDSLARAFDGPVDPSSSEDPFASATRSEDHSQTQVHLVAETMESAGPPLTVHPSQPQLNDAATEHLTYYTLPSYHENVRETTAARDLSEADVEAISRRLREVMRNQADQPGGNADGMGNMMPPRELIDHLVAEQLQPRP